MKRKIVVALLMSLVLVGCGKSQSKEIQEHIAEINSLEEQRAQEEAEDMGEFSEEDYLPSTPIDSATDAVASAVEPTESVSEGADDTSSVDTPSEDASVEDTTEVSEDAETNTNYQYSVIEVSSILDDYFEVTEDTVSTFADKYCVVPYNVVPAAPYGVTEYSVGIVELKSGNADDYTYTCSFHGLCSDYKGMFDRDGVVTFKFHGNKLYDASTEYEF